MAGATVGSGAGSAETDVLSESGKEPMVLAASTGTKVETGGVVSANGKPLSTGDVFGKPVKTAKMAVNKVMDISKNFRCPPRHHGRAGVGGAG